MKILFALPGLLALLPMSPPAIAQTSPAVCQARSGALRTPVIELYTSEGCSSCPPADQWLSSLKSLANKGQVVAQAFHVSYWDYIGWTDRFASPAHTIRQRQLAAQNRLTGIYTPQVLRDGRDWRNWHAGSLRLALPSTDAAKANIAIKQIGPDHFEATVATVEPGATRWAAYWTVTEHGHASRVSSGENRGEHLLHDFVVRQYTPVGDYKGAATLTLRTGPAHPMHPRQINLVVFDAANGQPLQALACTAP